MNEAVLWMILQLHAKALLIFTIASMAAYLLRRNAPALQYGSAKMMLAALLIAPLVLPFLPSVEVDWALPLQGTQSATAPAEIAERQSSASIESPPPYRVDRSRSTSESLGLFESSDIVESVGVLPVSGISLSTLVVIAYVALALLLMLRYAGLAWQVRRELQHLPPLHDASLSARLHACVERVGVRHDVTLLRNRANVTPFVWGFIKPVIVVPRDFAQWSASAQQSTLLHELTHIKKHDFAIGLAAKLCACLYWINPLAWKACASINLLAEKACDEAVSRLVDSPEHYADDLVQIARRLSQPGRTVAVLVPTIAGDASLRQRVVSILNSKQRSGTMNRISLVFTTLLLTGVSLTSVGIETDQAPPFRVAENADTRGYALLNRVNPHYPKAAAQNKIEGYAVVEFDINTAGSVENARIVDASPSQVFDQASLEAVQQWLYLPDFIDGEAQQTTGVRTKLTYVLGDRAGSEIDQSPLQGITVEAVEGDPGKYVVIHAENAVSERELYDFFSKLNAADMSPAQFKQLAEQLQKVAASGDSGNGYLALARLYESRAQWPAAQLAIAKAFEKGQLTDVASARFMAARILYHSNQLDGAKRVLQSLLAADTGNQEVATWLAVVDRESQRRTLVAERLVDSALR